MSDDRSKAMREASRKVTEIKESGDIGLFLSERASLERKESADGRKSGAERRRVDRSGRLLENASHEFTLTRATRWEIKSRRTVAKPLSAGYILQTRAKTFAAGKRVNGTSSFSWNRDDEKEYDIAYEYSVQLRSVRAFAFVVRGRYVFDDF